MNRKYVWEWWSTADPNGTSSHYRVNIEDKDTEDDENYKEMSNKGANKGYFFICDWFHMLTICFCVGKWLGLFRIYLLNHYFMILVFLPRNGFNFHYYTDILIYTSVILLQYHLKNITGKHTSISNNKYFGMAEYLDDE